MPIQSPSGLVHVPTCVPDQLLKNSGLLILSCRPLQPPTSLSPMITSGTSPAMITKNCSTSL